MQWRKHLFKNKRKRKADRSVRALYVHWTKTNSRSGTIVLAENILSKTLRINADVYCIFVTTRSSALITKRITLSQFIVFLSQFFYSSAPLISFVFANVMFITLVYSHSFVKCSCSPAYNVWMMHSQLKPFKLKILHNYLQKCTESVKKELHRIRHYLKLGD